MVEKGYKQTEVGVIPEDWEVDLIGNLLVFKNGLNKAREFFGYGTPIVNYMDVYSKNTLNSTDIKGKVFLSNSEIQRYEVKVGDVFFTRTSETPEEVGISSVVLDCHKNTVFSGFILRGRPVNNKLFNKFKSYCFQTKIVRNSIIQGCTYTTRALTNGTQLSKIRIPLPPLPEQTAIAEALSDMDALIAQTEKLIEKKRAIKQGMMQELLKPREGWVTKKLGEVCDIKKGQLITELTRVDGLIPVIAGGKTPAYFHNKPNRTGKTITISGSGASAGYVSFHNYPIFASDCSTISESTFYNIFFIFYWLQMHQYKIYKMQTGGAQPHIHPSDLYPMLISLPSVKEQSIIGQKITDIDFSISSSENKLQKIKRLKQGMMQALLTGKIRLI